MATLGDLAKLVRSKNAGPTLRDNLGLPIPRAADWHAARRRAAE